MADYSHEEMIKSYWNETKDELLKSNPSMTFEHFKMICKTPFEFVKEGMREESLPFFRYTHLGYFKVSRAAIKDRIKILKVKYIHGEITKLQCMEGLQFYKDYIKMISKLNTSDV